MKQWFLSRSTRERLLLTLAAAGLSLLMLYLLIWEPLSTAITRQQAHAVKQRDTLAWMQQAATEVRTLRARATTDADSSVSLLTLVDRTARQAGIRERVRQLKPTQDDVLQLWMEQVSFDTLIEWLGALEARHAVSVRSATIEQREHNGLVDVRINLGRDR